MKRNGHADMAKAIEDGNTGVRLHT